MEKSVAKTNQRLVERLRSEEDLGAVQSALDRGEITPRQAKNITKWITSAKAIRENYHLTAVVFDETSNQYVGEVVSNNSGASWIGRRYGRNYPQDSASFDEESEAVRFVGQALYHATETKGYNAAVPAEEIHIEETLGAVRVWRIRRTGAEPSVCDA